MFQICIDNDGYYAEGMTENVAEVEEIPEVEDVSHLQAYQFDKNTSRLVLDREKLDAIKSNSSSQVIMPTEAERLKAVEAAIAEMASVIYNN